MLFETVGFNELCCILLLKVDRFLWLRQRGAANSSLGNKNRVLSCKGKLIEYLEAFLHVSPDMVCLIQDVCA